jgi:hypothetical protein
MSQRTPRNGSTPTVLLVHGAFADASMGAGVIAELQAAGIGVIALANPLLGLVYVAGFALDEGESLLDITGRFPGSQLMPTLRPSTYADINGDPDVELYIDRAAFPHVFAADLSGRTAAAAQRPITTTAFEERSPGAAWKKIPCWYVIATTDLLIPDP